MIWKRVQEMLDHASIRIVNSVADFLPGVLALLTVLVFAFAIAFVLRVMVRRSLEGVQFDARMRKWGFSTVGDWSPSRSPAMLIAKLTFWTVIAIGLLIGVSALDANLTSLLVIRLFNYLPNVIAALLILFLGTLLARFLARGVLITAVNLQLPSARLLSVGVKWLMLVLVGAMALEHLGIGGQIVRLFFAILFGGIVLALALAVGLGSKDIVSRSLEKQVGKAEEDAETFQHL
jgi:hypothetical protein